MVWYLYLSETPLSHLETACAVTPTLCDNRSCVILLRSLCMRIFSPIFIILFHLLSFFPGTPLSYHGTGCKTIERSLIWIQPHFSLDKDFPSFYNKNESMILFLRRLFSVRRASAFSFRHDKNEIAYLFLRMEKEAFPWAISLLNTSASITRRATRSLKHWMT